MMLKIIFKFVIIVISISCVSTNFIDPPCYHDKGIKLATTTITISSDTSQKLAHIVEYDKYGRPIKRQEDKKRETTFIYEGENLKTTLVTNLPSPNSFDSESKDINSVIKNDEFGRPLIMKGHDNNVMYFNYKRCEKEIQTYKYEDGTIIHTYEIFKDDGIPKMAIFNQKNGAYTDTTKYFDYTFNSNGHWLERKYNFRKEDIIHEKRDLIYYK